jgi:hypothetical protein
MTLAKLNAGMIDHGNSDNFEETASEADTDCPHSMGALLSVLERANSISNNDRNVLDATAAC